MRVTRLDKVRSEAEGGTEGKDVKRTFKVVWSSRKTRKWVCGKENDGDGIRKEDKRKTQKVDGLYKRRP